MALNDLALSWKDHHSVIISVFEKLLEKEALVDCTLAADGKFLKAHKVVLSACSPYLEDLLNQESDKHPIIFLRDVHFDDLKTLVQFVYSGEIKIPEDRLVEFLNIAEALQIKGLGGGQNEAFEKKEVPQHRDTSTSVHRKRPRLNSDGSDSSDKNEPSCDNVRQRKGVKHRKETKLKTSNVGSTTSSCEVKSNTEVLNQEIPKVKEEVIEVIDPVPAVSHSPSAGQTSDPIPNDKSEGLDEVKPEFEQVTFTEDYSDELLLEENDGVKSVINPDEPSTSHQYSGYSSESFDTGGLEQSGTIANVTQPSPEGINIIQQKGTPSTLANANDETLESGRENLGRMQEYTKKSVTAYIDHPHFQNNKWLDLIVQRWPSFSMEKLKCEPANYREDKAGDRSVAAPLGCNMRPEIIQYSLSPELFEDEFLPHLYTNSAGKSFTSAIGSSRFPEDSGLKGFLQNHEGGRPFQCSYCPARFTEKGNLKSHLRTHTGERPFQCSLCPLSFTQSGSLKAHLLTHTGEKPFQCTFCSARFSLKARLNIHLRVHSGVKPYECSICQKKFSQKCNLNTHLQIHNRSQSNVENQ